MSTALTKRDVLRAIRDGGGLLNRTAYVNGRCYEGRHDWSYKDICRHVRRDLNDMLEGGLIARSDDTLGNYGYEWSLTEKGRAFRDAPDVA